MRFAHFRRCGQVQAAAEVPAAENDLGRRGDGLLLQGEIAELAQGNVQGIFKNESLCQVPSGLPAF